MTHPLSRRMFLGASAAAGLLATRGVAKDLAPAQLGAELYTVRSLMPAKDDDVLKQIAAIGYREVEGDYPTLMRAGARAKELGLNPVSCHLPVGVIGDDSYTGVGIEKIFGDLQRLGTQYAVVPYFAEDQRKAEIFRAFGGKMNKAGAIAKKHGLQLAYHNHAFEWAQMDGKRVFDIMFANTDPKLVQFEVDVFWLSVGGLKPVDFLNEHAGRVPLLHLKDKAQEQQVQYNEHVPKETFKEVGNGTLDFQAILTTAEKIGVKHYFVEQDATPGDPLDSLKQSFDFIHGLHT